MWSWSAFFVRKTILSKLMEGTLDATVAAASDDRHILFFSESQWRLKVSVPSIQL